MPERILGNFNRNILLAVDDSENSGRAVDYVAYLLGGLAGFRVTLLHVIPEPEEDFFSGPAEKERWLENYRSRMQAVLEGYRRVLCDAGFAPEGVAVRLRQRHCPSMAECILSETGAGDFGTIVVGRQGISRKEEFLFGSISSKIVSHARSYSVWVVA
jgi:nucleotide-binding universal stress UspA family protein